MVKGFIRIVVMAVGAAAGWSISQSLFVGTPNFHDQMVQVSAQINSTLPKMVDSVTRMDSTSVNDNHFCYHSTVLGRAAKMTADQISLAIRPNLVNNYRTNARMKVFRDNGVILDYFYNDSSGNQISEIEVKSSDVN